MDRVTIVGLEAAKNATPDGYPFVYSNVSNISLNPHMYEKLPYDGQKDFAPVTQLGLSVLAMVVPSSLRPKTLKEFIAYAKANQGKVSFASFGNGSTSHVYGEMLNSVGPHVASGRLVALAVTGPRRWPLLRDLPTFAEQGYALDIAGWNGIMAPAGTPCGHPAAGRRAHERRDHSSRYAEVGRSDTQRWNKGSMMKKFLFAILLAVPLIAAAAAMTNDDVIKMVKGGLGDTTVLQAIEGAEPGFDTSPDGGERLQRIRHHHRHP